MINGNLIDLFFISQINFDNLCHFERTIERIERK